ncbi:hypothetical protein RRG08_032745 [Elysia crispata]|uniref:Uncharacterized protein n=1 Tax=Elysia crispata TaxID=231223 RepID=A0AAE0YV10_9GAST|nr:hypothetical protein RRG08_032745 [Elysia crispata]
MSRNKPRTLDFRIPLVTCWCSCAGGESQDASGAAVSGTVRSRVHSGAGQWCAAGSRPAVNLTTHWLRRRLTSCRQPDHALVTSQAHVLPST